MRLLALPGAAQAGREPQEAMLRCMTVQMPRWLLAAVALALLGAAVFVFTYVDAGRLEVLGQERGDSRLVGIHSIAVRSASVTSDGRHVLVRYIGGYNGCGLFSSVRVTEQRGRVGVRVQLGNMPAPAGRVCDLGGRDFTTTVWLRRSLRPSTPVHQVL